MIRALPSASNSIAAASSWLTLSTSCAILLNNGNGSPSSMEKQQRIFGASNPIDEDLLAALADMPDASGAALGFDRLIMLATGAKRVEFRPVDSSF